MLGNRSRLLGPVIPGRFFVALLAWCLTQGVASADMILWSDVTGSIRAANTDGTGLRTIFSDNGDPISDLDVDAAGQKVYWTSTSGGLRRANLDGSGVETLVPDGAGDFQVAYVAVDSLRGQVYYKEFDPSKGANRDSIFRADLDGSNRTLIAEGYDSIFGIAVDSANGKLYFGDATSLTNTVVRSADLDGSNVQTLLNNLNAGFGLDVDPVSGSLYVVDNFRLLRANLDGTGVQNLPVDLAGLAIDPGRSIYGTARGIFRVDLDGSNYAPIPGLEDLGNAIPQYITFVRTTVTAVPEPASLALVGIGTLGLLGLGWHRRRAAGA